MNTTDQRSQAARVQADAVRIRRTSARCLAKRSTMPEKRSIAADLLLAVRLAWSLGYIIALPAVLFGFCGAYLDKYFGTSPWILLFGLASAMGISAIGVYRRLKEILPL